MEIRGRGHDSFIAQIRRLHAEDVVKYCKDCSHRNSEGLCCCPKLQEDMGQAGAERSDMLIYSYDEGGAFWVGPYFGCVHCAMDGSRK